MTPLSKRLAITAALIGALAATAGAYWYWKSEEAKRYLAEHLPNTRASGAGDAVLGAIGVKRYGKPTWFERTHAPRWQSLQVLRSAVIGLDAQLSARLGEFGVHAAEIGQAKLSAGIQSSQEAKLAILQIADASALAAEIDKAASDDSALADSLSAKDTRIVTAVGVLVSQQQESRITMATDAKMSGAASTSSVAGIATADIYAKFSIAPGAVLVYRMSRLCWDQRGRLARLQTDARGTDTCPDGLVPARPRFSSQ